MASPVRESPRPIAVLRQRRRMPPGKTEQKRENFCACRDSSSRNVHGSPGTFIFRLLRRISGGKSYKEIAHGPIDQTIGRLRISIKDLDRARIASARQEMQLMLPHQMRPCGVPRITPCQTDTSQVICCRARARFITAQSAEEAHLCIQAACGPSNYRCGRRNGFRKSSEYPRHHSYFQFPPEWVGLVTSVNFTLDVG